MNLFDYQPLALRTVKWFPTTALNLQHAALGLTTEFAELLEVTNLEELKEEAADLFWYCALFCHILESNAQDVIDLHQDVEFIDEGQAMIGLGKVVNFVKRVAIYEKTPTPQMLADAQDNLAALMHWARGLLTMDDFEDALEENIAKLRVRYPEAYSNEAAEARADKGGLGCEVS